MRILLPESVGKTPGTGTPLDLSLLSYQEFSACRRDVVQRVVAAASRPDALEIFSVGPRVADEVAAMIDLETAPASPARHVISGVLYEAASFGALSESEVAAIDDAIVIVTALFGFIHLSDPIPAYRAGMSTQLPDVGKISDLWKSTLRDYVLRDDETLFLNCCSAPYTEAWCPTQAQLKHTNKQVIAVSPKVRTPRGLTSVSHWAKFYRGQLAAALAPVAASITSPEELLDYLGSAPLGGIIDAFVECSGPSGTLSLVVDR